MPFVFSGSIFSKLPNYKKKWGSFELILNDAYPRIHEKDLKILEILKASLNYGKRPELFLFWDTNGNEVDLAIKKEIPVFQSLGRRPRALPTN